jgi:hypothetical protein
MYDGKTFQSIAAVLIVVGFLVDVSEAQVEESVCVSVRDSVWISGPGSKLCVGDVSVGGTREFVCRIG